jgi:recombinational DNA repair protein RecR
MWGSRVMDIEHTSKISTLEVTISQQAVQIKKLQQRIDELEYTDTDEVLIEANITLEGEANTYPYTHPIRDIPEYSKVKVND